MQPSRAMGACMADRLGVVVLEWNRHGPKQAAWRPMPAKPASPRESRPCRLSSGCGRADQHWFTGASTVALDEPPANVAVTLYSQVSRVTMGYSLYTHLLLPRYWLDESR